MHRATTRTASLLASAALLLAASPAMAAARPQHAPAPHAWHQHRGSDAHGTTGTLAVVPARSRVVTMGA